MYAENLKKLRKTLKISAKQMSLDISVPEATIWGYEGGKRVPSLEFPLQLYRKYNVNLNWFITGEGEMFNPPKFEDVKEDLELKVLDILKKQGLI